MPHAHPSGFPPRSQHGEGQALALRCGVAFFPVARGARMPYAHPSGFPRDRSMARDRPSPYVKERRFLPHITCIETPRSLLLSQAPRSLLLRRCPIFEHLFCIRPPQIQLPSPTVLSDFAQNLVPTRFQLAGDSVFIGDRGTIGIKSMDFRAI